MLTFLTTRGYNSFMNKYLKLKYIIVGLGLVAIIGTGTFLAVKQVIFKKNNSSNNQAQSDYNRKTEKTDNPAPVETKNPDEGKPTPTVNSGIGVLGEVFLTAYYNKDATTSADGKTTIPAGSIQPYLFPQGSGVYSVQKFVGGSWADVASNVSYSGHGGIAAAYAGPKEDNIQYRVIKLESGKPVSVSKIFVVVRADLVGSGVKTYN